MSKTISRRFFLKGSLSAVGAVAASLPLAKAAEAATAPEPLVTVIDISRCIGCEECVYACPEFTIPTQPSM